MLKRDLNFCFTQIYKIREYNENTQKIVQTNCCKDNIVETSASWQATWELLKSFFTNILGVLSIQKPTVPKSRQYVI